MSSTALSVGRSSSAYCVRVHGRCTKSQSPALHHFATHVFGESPETIYVDLRSCDYLDSTFLGSLLDLHRKYGRAPDLRLRLIAGDELRTRLFAPTHLHKVFNFEDEYPEAIENWVELCSETPLSKTEMARHIMECHRRLAEVDSPAQKTFAMIADQLESELATHSANPPA